MSKNYLLTREGLEKTKLKLSELEEKLKVIQSRKGEAAEVGGNAWHDNFDFEQLVQEENKLITETHELKDLIRNAKIVGDNSGGEVVEIGSRVKLKFDDGRQMQYEIVGLMQTDIAKNLISYDSPIGTTVMGARVGEKRKYKTPRGEREVLVIELT